MEDAVDYRQDVATEEVAEPSNVVKVEGVEYELDAEGNHCLNGIPVLDEKGVPFRNRVREIERKSGETQKDYERRIAEFEQRFNEKLMQMSSPQIKEPDDNEYDEKTGLTFGQIRALKAQFRTEWEQGIQQTQAQQANAYANQNVNTQFTKAQSNIRHKDFFQSDTFVSELNAELDKLDLNAAMRQDIVEEKIALIKGRHFDEFAKVRERDAYRRAQEGREIAGEYALSKPTTMTSGGRQFKITDEVREYASETRLPIELAAESFYRRQERLKGGNR